MQLLKNRPDEDALADAFYTQDQIDHIGDLPDPIPNVKMSIKMAKHHVISWSILRAAWNAADKKENHKFICFGIYKVMANAEAIPESEPTVRKNVCWSSGNLIIGPEGNIRLFDPDEKIDFETPAGMSGDALARVIDLVKFGVLLQSYKSKPKSIDESWKQSFNSVITSLDSNQVNLCVFDPNAWKLFSKPIIEWRQSPVDSSRKETGKTTQGYWYRAGVSAECVGKLFPDGADSKSIGMKKIKGARREQLEADLKYNMDVNRLRQMLKESLAKNAVQASGEHYVTPAILKGTD